MKFFRIHLATSFFFFECLMLPSWSLNFILASHQHSNFLVEIEEGFTSAGCLLFPFFVLSLNQTALRSITFNRTVLIFFLFVPFAF